MVVPCSSAQQVFYPNNPLQLGPMYFLTPRMCAIFGVCCEGIPRQINYLIDEAVNTGKGANSIVSMLDHYFDNHGLGEHTATLHADNCTGQNKNNTVLQYLMWRVMVGKHNSITISFMIVGHTKFAPDWCFGLLKQRYRKTEIGCLNDLAKVVNTSPTVNEAQLVGTQDGSVVVPTRDWATFLGSHFKNLARIKKYQHFHFSANHPGYVFIKQYSDSPEVSVQLIRE